MLYVSTRNGTNRFSPEDTLRTDRAPDGGAYAPVGLFPFSKEEIFAFKNQSFSETVAKILNVFFDTGLNAWDVEFCVGRYPYRFTPLHHRLFIAEVWNNLASTYEYFEKGIYDKLTENTANDRMPTHWAKIAIQTAALFGLFGELMRRGIYEADVSVQIDDFISPVAAWYARAMGLPVKKIICASGKNHLFWDLIHRGECTTGMMAADYDLISGIELLLLGEYGHREAERFSNCVSNRNSFILPEDNKDRFVHGFYVSVPSEDRVAATIRSIYQIHDYFVAPMAAQAFSGLQDYRARTGESRNALLLSLSCPVFFTQQLSKILGQPPQEIEALINKA